METTDKEKVREAVRDRYAKVARAGAIATSTDQVISCCGPEEASAGTDQTASCCGPVQISADMNEAEACCGPSDFSVEKMAQIMGYSKEDIQSVPEGANMGLGCGNPVALASLKSGETVVDLGSGGLAGPVV